MRKQNSDSTHGHEGARKEHLLHLELGGVRHHADAEQVNGRRNGSRTSARRVGIAITKRGKAENDPGEIWVVGDDGEGFDAIALDRSESVLQVSFMGGVRGDLLDQ